MWEQTNITMATSTLSRLCFKELMIIVIGTIFCVLIPLWVSILYHDLGSSNLILRISDGGFYYRCGEVMGVDRIKVAIHDSFINSGYFCLS